MAKRKAHKHEKSKGHRRSKTKPQPAVGEEAEENGPETAEDTVSFRNLVRQLRAAGVDDALSLVTYVDERDSQNPNFVTNHINMIRRTQPSEPLEADESGLCTYTPSNPAAYAAVVLFEKLSQAGLKFEGRAYDIVAAAVPRECKRTLEPEPIANTGL